MIGPDQLRLLDGLIDLLVEAVLRDIEAENEKPAAPGRASPRVEDEHEQTTRISSARN